MEVKREREKALQKEREPLYLERAPNPYKKARGRGGPRTHSQRRSIQEGPSCVHPHAEKEEIPKGERSTARFVANIDAYVCVKEGQAKGQRDPRSAGPLCKSTPVRE